MTFPGYESQTLAPIQTTPVTRVSNMTNITHIVGLWNAEKKSQLAKLAIIVPWCQQEEKVWVYSGVCEYTLSCLTKLKSF